MKDNPLVTTVNSPAMKDQLTERTERAKFLLTDIKYAAMATVDEDGAPRNSPYFFMINDERTELYWGSHPDSIHSKNIIRTGKLFVVLYRDDNPGGLYISCENGRIAADDELTRALSKHNQLRVQSGKDALPQSYYEDPFEQRMWICNTKTFYVNLPERVEDGKLREDIRIQAQPFDLL